MREKREMRRLVGLGVLIAVAASGAAVACRSVTCEENKTCTDGVDPGADGGNDGTVGGDGGPDGPVVPPGCKDSPANGGALEEKCGVFVSSVKGTETGAGTRESPVKSVTQGVQLAMASGKAWVFVCKGTYDELTAVKVEERSPTSLGVFGKLDCDSNWVVGTTRAIVKGAADEYVFALKSSNVVLEGIEVIAANATKPGGSSIAIFANGGALDVVDSVVKAGSAMDGLSGASGGAPLPKQDGGIPGQAVIGGGPAYCLCVDADAGTLGGAGGTSQPSAKPGDPGEPFYPGDAGAGGQGGLASCGANGAAGLGKDGAQGPDGGNGAHAPNAGTLNSAGWFPSSGGDGSYGQIGQGGGGGGAITGGGGGGSGGCGGCGGKPGLGGTGGGASVAIACNSSRVVVSKSELATGSAGRGGPPGDGQPGQQGGSGGNGMSGSCQGGAGGFGGRGGNGGGGAGGLSAAFLFTGTPSPERDLNTKVTLGDAGAPGAAGAFFNPAGEKFEVK